MKTENLKYTTENYPKTTRNNKENNNHLIQKCTYVFLVSCLIFCLCGCETIQTISLFDNAYIAFSNNIPLESEEIVFDILDFKKKNIGITEYRSSVFFDKLNETEKIVYSAYEFAMENGYENIFVDKSLISKSEYLSEILIYLSLDSPLLEQNLKYKIGSFKGIKCNSIGFSFDGFYISVKNFKKELWNFKLIAIEEAKKILEDFSEDFTLKQKAESIYRSISVIEFFDYKEITDSEYVEWGCCDVYPYLYNALISNKTNCDGYSNAVSLLYNMAGIPCVEKIYYDSQKDFGHTWNMFFIDDKWYNCDAMGGDMIPNIDDIAGAGLRFGFSDVLQENEPDYATLYPKSDECLYIRIDRHIGTVKNDILFQNVISAYKVHENKFVLILVDKATDHDIESQINKAVNTLNESIQYYIFPVKGNKKGIFIFKYGLFG